MSKVTLAFLFFLKVSFVISQNTVGTLSVSSNVSNGYTLFSIHKKAYLINNCGQIINEWTSQYLPGNSVYLLPNGNILRAGELDDGSSNITLGGHGGIVELFDWEGNIIWSYTYSTDTHRQHHDVFPMPNGNVLILAATVLNNTEAIQAGRDPQKLSESILYNEQIIEVEPFGLNQGNVVWEWNIIDHVIQDVDATKDNFGIVPDSPRKLDINFLNGWDGGRNWLHVNSIQYDSERDQIVLSSRHMSEIWIIDHSTTTLEASGSTGGLYGHGGDFLYRWGNPQAYGQGNESDRELYGQHMPYIIPEGLPNAGKIMLFNNGFGRIPNYSEIEIINPPVTSPGFYIYNDNSVFGPLLPDFSYPELPPSQDSEFFSAIVSNAQQLASGNILVCEGREGHFFELDENNNIVWDYIIPVSSDDGLPSEQFGTPPLNKLTFRALKYHDSYPAFIGKNLTPGNTIELNPNITFCQQTLRLSKTNDPNINIYPNPTLGRINIEHKNSDAINKLEVFSLSGSKLLEMYNSEYLDIKSLQNGVYFLRIIFKDKILIKKIVKQ